MVMAAQVARRIRARRRRPIKLLAVTGYGRETDRARAEKAGFDNYLAKPVELAELQRNLL